jgi:ribose transport system substrate-binding protein
MVRTIHHGSRRTATLLVGAVMAASIVGGSAALAQSPSAGEPLQLAYLSFAVANSYDAPMLAAAEAAAAAGNATVTVFDANNNPNDQARQLQDAVTSGQYDGIVVQPIYGAGLVTGVQDAISQGVAVANIDQILGADYTTADSQVDGLSANVVFVPSDMGTKIGQLVVAACKDAAADPCTVGYIYSVKASGLDGALRTAFDEAIKAGTNISVVAEGESFYQQSLGLKAAQDMLTAHPDLNVIVGADQAAIGALTAAQGAGVADTIRLVGYGGGQAGLDSVAAGTQFGTVMQLPASEGRLGVEQLIAAIRSGTPSAGMDPLAQLPDGGVVTKDNVQQFIPLAEWPG